MKRNGTRREEGEGDEEEWNEEGERWQGEK